MLIPARFDKQFIEVLLGCTAELFHRPQSGEHDVVEIIPHVLCQFLHSGADVPRA
ncbi:MULTISPECIES: hypothetical protein [Saccharothrix]|uniref:hypothetical protein n=1 Tax=Saccharothrix TaxID=2071 RepID=UPI001301857A|nr:hypothetical protein [Saccharothrix sp. CB00851]